MREQLVQGIPGPPLRLYDEATALDRDADLRPWPQLQDIEQGWRYCRMLEARPQAVKLVSAGKPRFASPLPPFSEWQGTNPRHSGYDGSVRSWIAITAGWTVALLALAAASKVPGDNLDLYFHDRYVVISKLSLIIGIVIVLVAPLAVATVRRALATKG